MGQMSGSLIRGIAIQMIINCIGIRIRNGEPPCAANSMRPESMYIVATCCGHVLSAEF